MPKFGAEISDIWGLLSFIFRDILGNSAQQGFCLAKNHVVGKNVGWQTWEKEFPVRFQMSSALLLYQQESAVADNPARCTASLQTVKFNK